MRAPPNPLSQKVCAAPACYCSENTRATNEQDRYQCKDPASPSRSGGTREKKIHGWVHVVWGSSATAPR